MGPDAVDSTFYFILLILSMIAAAVGQLILNQDQAQGLINGDSYLKVTGSGKSIFCMNEALDVLITFLGFYKQPNHRPF